jgi:hypothetical protein
MPEKLSPSTTANGYSRLRFLYTDSNIRLAASAADSGSMAGAHP